MPSVSSNSQKEEINRRLLSQIIFKDKGERQWLERLIHPTISNRLKKELNTYKDYPTIVLIIPLLFEANLYHLCSEVWVINCEIEQQLKRLMKRNQVTISEAKRMVNAQWSLEIKKNLADVIIDNTGESESWKEQVNQLF